MPRSGAAKRTEQEMLALLRKRHGETAGNGNAFAFIPHVRSAAGFDARRTIDAIAMSLWPSRGLLLDGFEVKCGRGDWLRELKEPAKAEEFVRLVDRFWVVAADKDIVKDGELPPGWGLLVPRGGGLQVVVQAQLSDVGPEPGERFRALPPGFTRSFLAALLRQATYVGSAAPEEVTAAYDRGREEAEARIGRRAELDREELLRHQNERREFEQALGIPLTGPWGTGSSPAEVGVTVRAVMEGEVNLTRYRNRLNNLLRTAAGLAEDLQRDLDYLERGGNGD